MLIGSGNPEEGELRPQLLDRFGLSVEVRTPQDLASRIEVVKRRDAFERDPVKFAAAWRSENRKLRRKVSVARNRVNLIAVPENILEMAAKICLTLGTDGLRGELTLMRAARALAAYEGVEAVNASHLKAVAPSSLRHRLRRDPLDEAGSTVRVELALQKTFG